MQKKPLIIAITCLLQACTSLAPDYERPSKVIPDQWPEGQAYVRQQQNETTISNLPWQSFVVDERLRKIIDIALANNQDLQKTIASIESARAQYRSQRAAYFPTITAGIDGSKARNLNTASGSQNTTAVSQSASANIGLSAYEFDLFGKVRSLSDSARESYLATEEASRATYISLIAETASAWLTLAADQSQLTLSRQTQESAQRTMEITRQRLAAGVSSRIDVRQAETIFQQARADVASNITAVAQDKNALTLLMGTNLQDETLLPTTLPTMQSLLADVPAGLSSEILLQRPDVLQAEHQLKSANADIGAARAAFFPSLSLTASAGIASTALSSLFSGGASIWSIAPSLSLPIFSGGANTAALDYSKAQKEYYLANYKSVVQTAFKETADALARHGTIDEQLAAQAALTDAASDSMNLANARYLKGVDTFLNMLDAQRTLYSAEQALISSKLTALDNRMTLYRVLGGGLADDNTSAKQ